MTTNIFILQTTCLRHKMKSKDYNQKNDPEEVFSV
jgi:hypothetical protein